jgi:serine phosphatase RsbU (regulator of sigma subunit)
MSVLGSALLKDVISSSDILKANQILNDLREKVILSLRQTGQEGEAKDGMDISLCIINTEKMSLQYAGANTPLYLVRQGRLKEIKADKMPIGISFKAGNSFTNHVMKIYKNDSIYLFTDGYVDQFGGESGRKFLSKQFKELILEVQNKIMIDQKEILNQRLNDWMGLTDQYQKHEQVDDITIMGIKI